MRRGNARRIGTEGAPKRRRVAQAGAGRSIHVVCVGPYSVVFFDFCVHGVFVLVPAVVVNVRRVMPGMRRPGSPRGARATVVVESAMIVPRSSSTAELQDQEQLLNHLSCPRTYGITERRQRSCACAPAAALEIASTRSIVYLAPSSYSIRSTRSLRRSRTLLALSLPPRPRPAHRAADGGQTQGAMLPTSRG